MIIRHLVALFGKTTVCSMNLKVGRNRLTSPAHLTSLKVGPVARQLPLDVAFITQQLVGCVLSGET